MKIGDKIFAILGNLTEATQYARYKVKRAIVKNFSISCRI